MNQPNVVAPADESVLTEIKRIIANRPSYGYRRVTAILNAGRHKAGLIISGFIG